MNISWSKVIEGFVIAMIVAVIHKKNGGPYRILLKLFAKICRRS
jgi:hypothetical protein